MRTSGEKGLGELRDSMDAVMQRAENVTKAYQEQIDSIRRSGEVRASVHAGPGPAGLLRDLHGVYRARAEVRNFQRKMAQAFRDMEVVLQDWQVLSVLCQGRADLLSLNSQKVLKELDTMKKGKATPAGKGKAPMRAV
jgi:hypothetical protein